MGLLGHPPERYTLFVCADCAQPAHGPGSRCPRDRRRTWTRMDEVEYVRADLHEGAVACRDALAKLVKAEWPAGQTLAEIAETHRVGFDYDITDDEIAALREWGQ